ncbi:hypothetical protein Tco_0730164 [Tanacetum coccineum]|uniref:Uncharacterized protein n=1 Tax=Tanacetum coccineum TaxID=301880 RepID=A0ABQ4YU39_9ASTR
MYCVVYRGMGREYVSLCLLVQVLWMRTQLTGDYGFSQFNKESNSTVISKSAIAISCKNRSITQELTHRCRLPFHTGTRGMGTIEICLFCTRRFDYHWKILFSNALPVDIFKIYVRALQTQIVVLQRQRIEDSDRLTQHIQHEHDRLREFKRTKYVALEDADSSS